MWARTWLLTVIVAGLGCGRWGLTYELQDEVGPDAAPVPTFDNTWTVSVSAERLAGPETMTSIDELDDGTEGLSLMEALVLASNTPGTDEIVFDPNVFTAGSQITLTEPLPLLTSDGITIDGSGATVLISAPSVAFNLLEILGSDVVVRGLQWFDLGGTAIYVKGGSRVIVEAQSIEAPTDVAIAFEAATESAILGTTIRNAVNDGIHIMSGSQIEIGDVTISDAGGYSVLVNDASSVTLVDSDIQRAGNTMVLFTNCTGITVKYNFMVVENKDTQKALMFDAVDDSWILENLIDPGDAHLVNLTDSNNNVVERNILDRGEAGVVLEGVSTGNLVFANVVTTPLLDGIYVSSTSTGNTIVHNTLYNCPAPIVDSSGDSVLGNNLISTDPADFVSPAAPDYDFTLAENSPNIDAGTDLGYDCYPNGPEKFLGAAPDLGAVETK